MEEAGNNSPEKNQYRVKVTENGPYAVTGGVPLA